MFDFSIKPFTLKLREEFLNSYNIQFSGNPFGRFETIAVPNLSCYIFYPRFLSFQVSTNVHPDSSEGAIKLNLLERFYVWGAIRDKLDEMDYISKQNNPRRE
jgi:hypothetical protein